MFMVQFTSAEGKPGQYVTESLDEAVSFVERLRNQEGITDTRLFRLTEIPLEVKAYYKVEVGQGPEDNGEVTETAVEKAASTES